ncbi:low density lipoprotein receptor adapter protein 1-like [Oscarella lobularis]|uniref:low density lipoprotein receptor adapter protein 1-like n=1 Tax=Oscarella lobularis TaxID=121494 RepID=UPI003313E444
MPFGKSSKGFNVSTKDPEATEVRATDRRETKQELATQTWLHTKEDMLTGVLFDVEYLGYDEVQKPTGRQNSSEIIERLAKREGRHVSLRISANGFRVENDDFETDNPMKFVQMYRISFTTVDKIRRRVFFFIGRDRESKKLLMHILQCKTKRQASEITLTVAQGFQIAFEMFEKRDPEAQKLLKERDEKEEVKVEASSDVVKLRKRRVSVRLQHKAQPEKELKDHDLDRHVDMPDEDIREEYKRMTILRDIPDLPDMDFDPNDASDDIALFLGGEITAKQMTEKS